MSKKNTKNKKSGHYPKYSFDRFAAIKWNDDSYYTWLIMDEGQERPDPMRLTNFLLKYGKKNKITGKSILSYLPEEYKKVIFEWVRMTKAERKSCFRYDHNVGRKITRWLHAAEVAQWEAIDKLKKK